MRRFRPLIVMLLSASLLGGCGGSKSSPKPLALRDRVIKEGEVSGFTCYPGAPAGVPKPPCAQPVTTVGLLVPVLYINNPRGAFKRLRLANAGFVRGMTANFERKKGNGNAQSTTVQFATEKQAEDFLGRLFPESLAPCPEACEVVKKEFHVSGIDGAKGAALSQTTGPKALRFVAYRIEFADGPFVYEVGANGPVGGLSADDVVAVAKVLDERVRGRPAAVR